MATLCAVPSVGRPRSSTIPWPASTLRCALADDSGPRDWLPVPSFLSEQAARLSSRAKNMGRNATLIDLVIADLQWLSIRRASAASVGETRCNMNLNPVFTSLHDASRMTIGGLVEHDAFLPHSRRASSSDCQFAITWKPTLERDVTGTFS